MLYLGINKELLPVTGAQGHFPSSSHIPAAPGCCCILPAVTHRASSPQHSQCCAPSSPVPEESSAPPGLSCSLCPHPGLGKRLQIVPWTQPGPVPPCLVQAPHRRQQLCPCPSCQPVPKLFMGKQKVMLVLQGQGALQAPQAQCLLSCFLPPTTQAGKNKRKQSHGKAGPIPIKATKVNVSFGCQESSSIISFFSVSVMRAVALEISIAVFLQTVPSSNLLEIGFCGAEQFVCSR